MAESPSGCERSSGAASTWPPADRCGAPVIRWLSLADGVPRELVSRLGTRERAEMQRFGSPMRRLEWAAGRNLMKLAWLRWSTGLGSDRRFAPVRWDELEAAAAVADFREIEVLAGSDGAPTLTCPGRAHRGLSLAHKFPYVAATCHSAQRRVGVDLERVRRFEPEFVDFHLGFERGWIDALAATRAEPEWLQTLAWTLKEAAFKSGAAPAGDLREVKVQLIDLPCHPERRAGTQRLRVEVRSGARVLAGIADVLTRGDMIATVVELVPARVDANK